MANEDERTTDGAVSAGKSGEERDFSNGSAGTYELMELIDRMITTVPVYRLKCRNDISAAETAIRYFGL